MVGILIIPLSSATWGSNFNTPITLSGDAITEIILRPALDSVSLKKEDKPTQVTRGIVQGYSFPIYACDDEEMFFRLRLPRRWDEASNITVTGCVLIPEANMNGKKFNLSMDYIWGTCGEVVPETNYTTYHEVTCSSDLAYVSYDVEAEFQYDVDLGKPLTADDTLFFRIYRTAASSDEITGEVVLLETYLVFKRDKLGVIT